MDDSRCSKTHIERSEAHLGHFSSHVVNITWSCDRLVESDGSIWGGMGLPSRSRDPIPLRVYKLALPPTFSSFPSSLLHTYLVTATVIKKTVRPCESPALHSAAAIARKYPSGSLVAQFLMAFHW